MEDNRNAIRYKGDVYRHIYKNKASSRQMIAADLGLSLPTVTMTLNYLMEEGPDLSCRRIRIHRRAEGQHDQHCPRSRCGGGN